MADDDLTEGEKAYLESGGESADALLAENNAAAATEAPKPVAAEPAKETPKEAPKEPAKETPKAADAAEPAPAPAVTDDDDDAPTDPKATVPYQKYARDRKKERERAARLEKELAETREKLTRGDERLRLLSEVMAPPPQQQAEEEDPEPDPNEDIVGWANWSRRENARLREAISTTQGVVRDTNDGQALREGYQRDAVAFTRENPDFGVAYNYLITARAGTLEAQGYGEQEIRQIIHNEERALVERAAKAGKRPAAMIYAMAQQFGYRKAAPAAQAAPAAAAAAAAAPAAPAVPSVTEEIERIARGQAAGKSLSDAGGGAPSELTVEALANMSDREFQALYAKKRADVDALLGKRAH